MAFRRTSKRIKERAERGLHCNTMSDTPKEQPEWLGAILKRLDAIESTQRSVANLQTVSIPAIEKSLESLHASFDNVSKTVDKKCDDLENDMMLLRGENAKLKKELSDVKAKLLYQDSQNRRNNLVFKGIEESKNETWEDSEKKIYEILKDMKIDNSDEIQIERAHRIHFKKEGVIRPITVKFLSYKDRQKVLLNRKNITNRRIRIFEDYPQEIETNRQKLWPIFIAAKQLPEFTSVQLKLDKLYINRKQFTTENLNELPPSLHPEKRSTKFTDQTVVFYSKYSTFSNFHELDIKHEGQVYCCNEQYFQQCKALHFGDNETAQRILNEKDPHKIHELGKQVKGFNKELWDKQAYRILKQANLFKYQQNPEAQMALLNTGKRSIGEASRDTLYGIGIPITSPNAGEEGEWHGKNWMGKILTEVRETLNKPS